MSSSFTRNHSPPSSPDLPQLYILSYDARESSLQFDYLPDSARSSAWHDEQLCLNIRQSSDGKMYQSMERCLPIVNRRVQWEIEEEYPHLKLSVCSKKHRYICGAEIEMKEGRPAA